MKKIIYILSVLLLIFQAAHAQPDWTVNSADYEYSMTITGVILFDGTESTDVNDMVGAFVGDECRGVAQPIFVESLDRYLVFGMIYSNVASNETISFKTYNADADTENDVDLTVDFEANSSYGSPSFPVIWSYPALSTECDLLSFSIDGQIGTSELDSDNKTVTILMPFEADVSNLVADFSVSESANVRVGSIAQESGITANDFTNTVVYTVTAEDGLHFTEWLVTVNKEQPGSATNISAFSVTGQTVPAVINTTMASVLVKVPLTTNLNNLIAEFTLSEGATAYINGLMQISGVTANDFTNPVVYKIVAQDETERNWLVTVEQVRNETDFLSFAIPVQAQAASINSETHIIDVLVEKDTDLSALTPLFSSSEGAVAFINGVEQISGTSSVNFTNPVVYEVIAEDEITIQEWTINVSFVQNTDTEILSFEFAEQSAPAAINSPQQTISISVNEGTDITALIASFTLSEGATAYVNEVEQISGTTANNFTNSLVYEIVAEDGITTQNWTIIVSVEDNISDENDFLTFGFAEQIGLTEINTENHTVNLNVPIGTDKTDLVAIFTISEGATVQISGVEQVSGETHNDFSSPVIYKVIAQSGAMQNWTITVSSQGELSNAANILSFSFADITIATDIDSDAKTVSVLTQSGSDLTNLVAYFTLSANAVAKVDGTEQMNGETSNDFTSTVIYSVTAEDGTTIQDWVITVTVDTYIDEIQQSNDLVFYPNPSSGTIYFNDFDNLNDETFVEIFDMTGKSVFKTKAANVLRLDLHSGLYILKTSNPKFTISKRLVIK